MQNLAPVVVFAFNRPDHLRLTLESLAGNHLAEATKVYVYCDGPRSSDEKNKTEAVRNVAKSAQGFKNLHVVESDINLGLAQSIISGVTNICSEFGKVIVLEDDMVTSPYFLTFMNEGLTKYQDDQGVISIHGYTYPFEKKLTEAFFLRGADCWGWATWDRGWKLFESRGEFLLQQLEKRKLLSRFNFNGTYEYEKMLKDFIAGKNNSWAIRWYASALLAGKLTLYPPVSLVKNIGIDSSGTHCGTATVFDGELADRKIQIPDSIPEENRGVYKEFCRFFLSKMNLKQRALYLLRNLFV